MEKFAERNTRNSRDEVAKNTAEQMPDHQAVARALAAWWETNARDLPWRFGRTTPWGVLVSEVMSQQTQMSRVVPYWQAWMEAWPDARSLSQASTAEVITAWGRLGYPRRALRLQECARVVSDQYHNGLPQTYEELIALPGIGDYTASAVLSFAFGTRIAVIDTNIRRVLSRVFLGEESLGGSASKAERELAQQVLPEDSQLQPSAGIADATAQSTSKRLEQRSVVWNQSVMELGALVCTAKTPDCEHCPIQQLCRFYAEGLPGLGEKRTRPRQRFQGTDRQVRGIILHALREAEHYTLAREQLQQLWDNIYQFDECLASLDNDGLVEILSDGMVRLPQ